MTDWYGISEQIVAATGDRIERPGPVAVGGGCINEATRLDGRDRRYFVKTNRASSLAMFEAEAEGLQAMSATDGLRIPTPYVCGIAGKNAFIAMEFFRLGGHGECAMAALGRGLANMHAITADQFGWHRDNTIGSTLQPNDQSSNWIEFLAKQRIGFQLQLAMQNGGAIRLRDSGEELLGRLADFFSDYMPAPSLLHGDLWSGNYAITEDGKPTVFDPAVYFGDREADMAMTELFGGFGRAFYAAYNDVAPLDCGYATRKTLYNLYHILNHFNLFGGGYQSQAQDMIDRLLSELR